MRETHPRVRDSERKKEKKRWWKPYRALAGCPITALYTHTHTSHKIDIYTRAHLNIHIGERPCCCFVAFFSVSLIVVLSLFFLFHFLFLFFFLTRYPFFVWFCSRLVGLAPDPTAIQGSPKVKVLTLLHWFKKEKNGRWRTRPFFILFDFFFLFIIIFFFCMYRLSCTIFVCFNVFLFFFGGGTPDW